MNTFGGLSGDMPALIVSGTGWFSTPEIVSGGTLDTLRRAVCLPCLVQSWRKKKHSAFSTQQSARKPNAQKSHHGGG
jgi:hypothetical protein